MRPDPHILYRRLEGTNDVVPHAPVICLRDGSALVYRHDGSVRLPLVSELQAEDLIPNATIHQIALSHDRPVYCVEADHDEPAAPLVLETYRNLFGVLNDVDFGLMGRAMQILDWDRTTQFCPVCGRKTIVATTEAAKSCECGHTQYPRLAPAMIVAVVRDGKLLLGQSPRFKGQFHSILAGFVEAGESVEECVVREVWEEVRVRVTDVEYWGSQPWPFPHSLMLGFTARYLSGEIDPDPAEIIHAEWYGPDELPDVPSEVSISGKIIRWFVERYGAKP